MTTDLISLVRIQITRVESGFIATLVGREAVICAGWELFDEENETVLERSQIDSSTWIPDYEFNSGKYKIVCNVKTDAEATVAVSSRPFSYGRNLQNIPPRRLPVNRPNEVHPSFKYLIYLEGRKAFRRPEYSAWLLDNKTNAYKFADLLGIKTPLIDPDPTDANSIKIEPDTVIKPLTGVMSKGVFLVKSDQIIDLYENEVFQTHDELRYRMNSLVSTGTIKEDLWIRERLIYGDITPEEPARDIKFYTFYGQIELVLETVRANEVTRCWYDISRNRINTGKYTNNLFDGHGIPDEYYAMAQYVSENIPAPFARIDLLASAEGPVLNEVTPKPGGSNQFAPSIDRKLGDSLVAADSRLRKDLLDGKTFDIFRSIQELSKIK